MRSAAASSTYDMPAIRAIVARRGKQDYRISAFILGIVNSAAFRMARVAGGNDDRSQRPK